RGRTGLVAGRGNQRPAIDGPEGVAPRIEPLTVNVGVRAPRVGPGELDPAEVVRDDHRVRLRAGRSGDADAGRPPRRLSAAVDVLASDVAPVSRPLNPSEVCAA